MFVVLPRDLTSEGEFYAHKTFVISAFDSLALSTFITGLKAGSNLLILVALIALEEYHGKQTPKDYIFH
jgi:hypothetical protein